MCSQDGVTPAIDKAEHIVLGDLVAKANATRTKNAALVIERHAWTQFYILRLFNFVF